MGWHRFTDQNDDVWDVAYRAESGRYTAERLEIYSFEGRDAWGWGEKWSAHFDRETHEFVCEWVDATAYSADHARAYSTIEDLRSDQGHVVPAKIIEKLARDAAGPRLWWGEEAGLAALDELERALAGHVVLPQAVRSVFAREEARRRRGSAQVSHVVRASFPQPVTGLAPQRRPAALWADRSQTGPGRAGTALGDDAPG